MFSLSATTFFLLKRQLLSTASLILEQFIIRYNIQMKYTLKHLIIFIINQLLEIYIKLFILVEIQLVEMGIVFVNKRNVVNDVVHLEKRTIDERLGLFREIKNQLLKKRTKTTQRFKTVQTNTKKIIFFTERTSFPKDFNKNDCLLLNEQFFLE